MIILFYHSTPLTKATGSPRRHTSKGIRAKWNGHVGVACPMLIQRMLSNSRLGRR